MTRFARRPPPLAPGDRVGVAALSGPVAADAVDAGLEGIRALGYEPVTAANLGDRAGLFAGSDRRRLDAFHRLAADPGIRAIFFARGGHGVLRLLPRIDWDLLGRHPRAYVGYSDLTALLNLITSRLGLATFHGPMVGVELARGLSRAESRSLRSELEGRPQPPLRVAIAGRRRRAEGPLMGGCLSLLTATLGTPFAPRLDGAVLFWEETGEPLYRLDRMLTHLRLSGTLARLQGMVVGRLDSSDADSGHGLGEWLLETARELDLPLAHGCASGHCAPNLTLPLGLPARLRPGRGELEVGG